MNEDLSINCSYTLSSETQLTSFDRKIISQLYQPILGYQAIALYFTLCSEVEVDRVYSTPSRINRLCRIMNMDIKQLQNSFNLVEALGLVKTFIKKNEIEHSYHFVIYSPNSPKQFFNNPLLVNNLKLALESNDFHKTKMMFKLDSFNYKEYENISKKYKEVFSLNHDPRILNEDDYYKDYRYAKIESEIDFTVLKETLKKYNLHTLLLDNNKKNYIEMTMLEYNLDSNQLLDAFLSCINDGEVDFKELDKYLKMKSKINQNKIELERVYLTNKKGNNIYDTNSVYEYLKKYYSFLKINISNLKKIENLMKEYPLNNGVYNVLIELVIKLKRYLDLNYLRPIAQQWYQANIDTSEKAIEKVKSINTNRKTKNHSTSKKVIGSTDDWYQKQDDDNVNEADIKVLEEWFKNR